MYNSVVIGGGFFGCLIASGLSKLHGNTLLIESEEQVLNRASKNNQARVHGGYHYPRSYMTARRSRANFKEFTQQFPLSIFESYKNIYAVARNYSHITAGQFEQFCKRIDAPITETPKEISELFDTNLTEKTFLTQEVSFNWQKLAEYCLNELSEHQVKVRLCTS
jgi:monoamine oxidase